MTIDDPLHWAGAHPRPDEDAAKLLDEMVDPHTLGYVKAMITQAIINQEWDWGVAVLRERRDGGMSAWEYHRHHNEESARAALREEHRRMGLGVVPTKAAHLVRRPRVTWEVVKDDD